MNTLQLIICTFDGETKADQVRTVIQKLDQDSDIVNLENIAVVKKTPEGKITFTETRQTEERQLGMAYLVAAGVASLALAPLLGPVAVLGGMAGVALLNLSFSAQDLGFADEQLYSLGTSLAAGSSALVTIADTPAEAQLVIAELERLGGTLLQTTLPEATISRLQDAQPSPRDH